MFPVAWFFLLHLHKIFFSKNPLLDFSQTAFPKKCHQWYGYSCKNNGPLGAPPETKTISRTCKKSFHAPREKGRVARALTSATVKTNSLQSLQGQNIKKRFVLRHNTNHRGNGEATAHSNQAFGAFWCRVTPPELLYVWLLSFDELRLAMNAHLPVVRPLLCYARRGATPMHQKKNIKKTTKANIFHTSSAEFQSWANTPAQGLTRVH